MNDNCGNEKCIHEDICEFSGGDHCSSDLKICPYYLPESNKITNCGLIERLKQTIFLIENTRRRQVIKERQGNEN